MNVRYIAAVDLGASSGRVMLATYTGHTQKLTLEEIHRFDNQLELKQGHHCWDLDNLEQQILIGLNKLSQRDITIDSIGIDTWGVDYVLLDEHGQPVGPSYAYRDSRTEGVMAQVCQDIGKEAIYQKTGIQFLTFNTLYQLKALVDENPDWLAQVCHFVMIPDYLAYRLTGELNCEYTNATTTQLLNIEHGDWDSNLLNYLNLPKAWFGDVTQPGNRIGYGHSPKGERIPVTAVASHDTASAVIATPLHSEHCAYLSSGTWSLMGLDSPQSHTSQQALDCNITNEGGVNGHFRVLKNIMGLWLFQRLCHEHHVDDICELIDDVSKLPAFKTLIDPNDARFLNPVSMTEAIADFCRETGQNAPQTIAEFARCVFDSLALLYKHVANELAQLNHHPLEQLYIVGGGSQNALLNQLCADACGIAVSAGPIEASTLGNVGCQLIALDELNSVREFHQIITRNFPLQHYVARANGGSDAWERFLAIRNR